MNGVCLPGSTLFLNAYVNNVGDQPVESLIVLKLDGLPDQQFERRYTFPPHEVRQVPIRVTIPLSFRNKPHASVEATVFGIVDGREVMLDVNGVPVRNNLRIPISTYPLLTFSSIPRPPEQLPWWFWPPQIPDYSYEIIVANKVASGSSRAMFGQTLRPQPTDMEDWQALDVSVIADDFVLRNANTLDSLRRHMNSGGAVWVMLDKVPIELVRPLLVAGQSIEVLDKTQITDFVAESSEASVKTLSLADRTVSSSAPFDLVRTIQSGGDATFWVDNWPIAITFPIGDGKLVLTTLDASAWVRNRVGKQDDVNRSSFFEPQVWNSVLFRKLFTVKHPRQNYPVGTHEHSVGVGREFAQSMIGNPVVPRGTVAATLLGFVVFLAAGTGWFGMRGQWKAIAIATPALGMVVATIFLGIASSVRHDIPEMSASLSLAKVGSDGLSSLIYQQGAVNLISTRDMSLQSQLPGTAAVDSTVVTSGLKRFEQNGFEQWSLKNATWPPGIWSYQAEVVEHHHDSRIVTASVTAQGLNIKLPDSVEDLSDLVLCFQPGQPMLGKRVGQNWLFDGSQPASVNRWTSAGLLDNEQLRRQQVMNSLLIPNQNTPGWTNSLMGWTAAQQSIHWSHEMPHHGSTLMILPVQMSKPDAGQHVLVPAGLIRLQYDPRDPAQTLIFHPDSGAWLDRSTRSAKLALRFSIPESLLPLEVDTVELQLDMNAAKRSVTLYNTNAEPKLLATLDSPSIPWKASFKANELEVSSEGNFHIMIQVSDRIGLSAGELDESELSWNINSFRASCTGHRKSMLKN
ncbi:MAG: hypothetical protein U0930_02495 [Pirellulales bacterium]